AREQKALTEKERNLQAREVKLEHAEQDIEAQVVKRLFFQKAKFGKEALDKARAEVSLELKDLTADAADKELKLKTAEANELQLRKEKRDLEAGKKILELEVARKVDAEREHIREEALTQAAEEHRLKDA